MHISRTITVADVGGTNVRFGQVRMDDKGALTLLESQRFFCADFPNFEVALRQYLDSGIAVASDVLSISLAGPVRGQKARMTNLDWEFDAVALSKNSGFDKVHLLHDLAAQALAIPVLSGEYLHPLRRGQLYAEGSKAVIGLGTGLGIAQLNPAATGWNATSGEGGHASFGPHNDLEQQIFEYLRSRFGYVSLEMLLSGPGLTNIANCLAAIEGHSIAEKSPKEILGVAERDSYSVCAKATAVFVSVLADVAGNVALTLGATGGVYLAGGVTRHLVPFLTEAEFSAGFLGGGFRATYLKDIPVDAVLHPYAGLLGAANYVVTRGLHC